MLWPLFQRTAKHHFRTGSCAQIEEAIARRDIKCFFRSWGPAYDYQQRGVNVISSPVRWNRFSSNTHQRTRPYARMSWLPGWVRRSVGECGLANNSMRECDIVLVDGVPWETTEAALIGSLCFDAVCAPRSATPQRYVAKCFLSCLIHGWGYFDVETVDGTPSSGDMDEGCMFTWPGVSKTRAGENCHGPLLKYISLNPCFFQVFAACRHRSYKWSPVFFSKNH